MTASTSVLLSTPTATQLQGTCQHNGCSATCSVVICITGLTPTVGLPPTAARASHAHGTRRQLVESSCNCCMSGHCQQWPWPATRPPCWLCGMSIQYRRGTHQLSLIQHRTAPHMHSNNCRWSVFIMAYSRRPRDTRGRVCHHKTGGHHPTVTQGTSVPLHAPDSKCIKTIRSRLARCLKDTTLSSSHGSCDPALA